MCGFSAKLYWYDDMSGSQTAFQGTPVGAVQSLGVCQMLIGSLGSFCE